MDGWMAAMDEWMDGWMAKGICLISIITPSMFGQ